MTHAASCRWERTTDAECEYRATHHYCPHPEHECDCPPAASPVERELELLKRIAGAANTIVAWFHSEDVRSGCVLINVEHYDELNAASDDYCKLLRDKTSPPPPSEKPSVTSVRSTEGESE
jgi:hypothetical protein